MLADAVKLVEELTGKQSVIERKPRHPADVPATWADITKAEKMLGWRPQTDFRTGVGKLVDWYNAERTWASKISTGS